MLKGNHSCHQRYRFSPSEERGIVGVNFFAQEHDKRTPQELDSGIINSEDIRLTFGSPSIIVLLFMFCYHEKYAFAPDSLRKRSLTEKKTYCLRTSCHLSSQSNQLDKNIGYQRILLHRNDCILHCLQCKGLKL